MANLRQKWKRAKCLLSGGCKYDAKELVITYTPAHGFSEAEYHIYNECVKCGKPFKGELPADKVDKFLLWTNGRQK